jgi:DNA-binding transcriptional MerR regulator
MKNLLPIGRFSQVTRLSIRMLRHYDEVGLLKPALVDPDSGYRYYSPAQAADAEKIRLLRSLEMPLEEIGELLGASPEELQAHLHGHKLRLEARLAQYRQAITALEHLSSRQLSSYTVGLRLEVAQAVLSKHCRSNLETMKAELNTIFGELFAVLGRQNLRLAGAPFISYHSPEFNEDDLEYEVGLPTDQLAQAPTGLASYQLAASPVAYTLHVGPYETLERAYLAVTAWVQEHGHTLAGPPREHYLVSKDQVEDPALYRTELLWPIQP